MSVRTCRAASTCPWQGTLLSSVEVATPERRAEESVPGRAYASPASPRTGDRGSRSTALTLQATRIITSNACWRAPETECLICWSLDKRQHAMCQSSERRRMTATGRGVPIDIDINQYINHIYNMHVVPIHQWKSGTKSLVFTLELRLIDEGMRVPHISPRLLGTLLALRREHHMPHIAQPTAAVTAAVTPGQTDAH